ncbi:MAG: nucleoside-diphosphate-sugar epimerase/choline dehydrogenase-like flavoprotein [Myxococcota bacterium]|jgi:nucleoside-diphosphate-sugar epimerase/choline dehydrogenase-like flavoprotein
MSTQAIYNEEDIPERPSKAQVVVIGSGAGGAMTAATLAEGGYEVLILEEGPRLDTSAIVSNSTDALSSLYRNGGMTPILGAQNIAYVEGRCVGGSTEVNSGFWHRLPKDSYYRWKADYLLDEFSESTMSETFATIEKELSVSRAGLEAETRGSSVFRKGIEGLGWKYEEVPRCLKDSSASAFAPGAKQSMYQTYIPRALRAGAKLLPNCKAKRLVLEGNRVVAVEAQIETEQGRRTWRIQAEMIFVCCGAIQSPALLRRSGITKNVGDNLRIHPMIKAAGLFEDEMEPSDSVIPVYQVKEFWPTITLGGSVYTPGFLAMLLSDNWEAHQSVMQNYDRMGLYYAATRGLNRGSIRVLPGIDDGVVIRYRLSEADQRNLSIGLAHLGELLFSAGAKAVYPSLRGFPALTSAAQCRSFLKNPLPISSMSLSTVHVFSSCPMGENPDLCATDSFGKVRGFDNLYVNDASLLPDSPGVNPQGSIMAIAHRNSNHVLEESARMGRRPKLHNLASSSQANVLVTGATGWLGTRLIHQLYDEDAAMGLATDHVRCLVPPGLDPSHLTSISDNVNIARGDLKDPESLSEFCSGAEGSTLFHVAGIIHPGRPKEFDEVNVAGTANILAAAKEAGVARVVVMSSNSPLGNNPHAGHVFDEESPYNPYMAYGRSKVAMEKVVHAAQARGDFETVIIRAPWFYGPNQPERQTTFFKMIKQGGFPILGSGEQKRSMSYLDNLCQGLFLAATVPHAAGETYWIADERPYSINEIVDTVEDVLSNDFGIPCSGKRMRLPSILGDIAERTDAALQAMGLYEQRVHVLGEMNKTIVCTTAKAQRELGYAPKYSLRSGMAASIRWCLENGQHL